MFPKRITPKYIIEAHLNTIRNEKTGKLYVSDIILLFIVPVIISFILTVILKFFVKEEIAGSLLTILSISIPLLFSLLVLLYDMGQNILSTEFELNRETKLKVIDETSNNISFVIFLSICLIVIIGIYILIMNSLYIFNPEIINNHWKMIYTFSGIIYWFLGVFILNFLMILNKVQILTTSSFPHNEK